MTPACRKRSLFAGACSVLLSGCWQDLGDYEVVAVTIVSELPASFGVQPYPQYVAIDLASETDLAKIADRVSGFYSHADFCSQRRQTGLIALGPVDETGQSLDGASTNTSKAPRSDGRFIYRVFVASAHPFAGLQYSKTFMADQPRYDLRRGTEDVCVKISAPGASISPSESRVIVVSGQLIATALQRKGSAMPPTNDR